jgi:hypothetical protein
MFSDETARSQLVEEGVVVTFRTSERTTGETWWRKTRTGTKEGDCYITRLKTVDASQREQLAPYRRLSGFESVSDWQAAIRELNGDLSEGILYRVQNPEQIYSDRIFDSTESDN